MRFALVAALVVVLAACGSTSQTASVTPATSTSPIGEPTPIQSPLIPCLPTEGGTSARATITDVRVGTHTGYDRFVVEFSGGGMPAYKLVWQDPKTFVGPASGIPVSVAGVAALHLYIYGMDIPPTYQHGTNLMADGYPVLQQVVVMGVFEGQADIAIGLRRAVCPTISTMTGPNRLVLDFMT